MVSLFQAIMLILNVIWFIMIAHIIMSWLISFQVLIQRLEDIRLKYPAKAHPYTPSFFGRNLQALDIEFKAAR